jgi:zinc/manganese transport system substrate-binding protein
LVTGHDSLGYFAARYGCEVTGAIIPSLSTTAEASAKELAQLREIAQSEGVAAVFTEPGTAKDVADQIASEIGVPLVELPTVALPDDGSYTTFITDLATTIADALCTTC